MKAFFIRSMMGIFFGGFMALMVTIALLHYDGQAAIDGPLFIKDAFGYILCGWLFTTTPLYFENRSLGLPMQTALHFLTVTIVYLLLSLWIGWFPVDITNFLLYLLIAILVYTIGWVSFYLYFKQVSKKLNNDLRKR